MHNAIEAMTRLRAFAASPVDTRVARELDPHQELAAFVQEAARLRVTLGTNGSKQPTGVDVDALWKSWRPHAPAPLAPFSTRELRALCWDRRAVSDVRFLAAIEEAGYVPTKLGFLRGLWHVHQQHWRLTTAPILERLFEQAGSTGNRPPRWMQAAREVPKLFSVSAPQALSTRLLTDLEHVQGSLSGLGIVPDGGLAQEALRLCRREWLELVRRYAHEDAAGVPTIVVAGLRGLVAKELIPPDEFRTMVERLLLVPRSGERYQRVMKEWIDDDERLGHPQRRATSPNWAGISEEARFAALRLFASKDLERFFDILIGTADDDQGRRPFWEGYVNSPQFKNYAIASDWIDRELLVAKWGKGTPDVASLEGAPRSHSAFIMRFITGQYDLMIVEMSRANNSMYLFNTQDFEQHVGRIESSRFAFSALKYRHLAVDHWRHREGWQERFTMKLRSYGIFPGRP